MPIQRGLSMMREFLKLESAGGLLLLAAAVLALAFVNSPLAWAYNALLTLPVEVQVGALEIAKPLLLWINDGLMAIFFLLVGLELKREVLEGELSSWDRASLPLIGALGGMLAPAAVFLAVNWDSPENLRGWAIPAATDIAFALGILALVGARAPTALKVFLLALAIIDDLGAILVIALFYTADLSLVSLALAGAGLLLLAFLNWRGVTRIAPYLLIGLAIWVCVLKSGVHATLAGVATALFIPLSGRDEEGHVPLRHLEHILHPWVAFAIMPLFAFANAGVPLLGLSFEVLLEPLPLGIALGLFLGKQLGVLLFSWLGILTGAARLPDRVTWPQFYGAALLTGVGFTMSLFIGALAFPGAEQASAVRLGVLCGSLISALAGYLLLALVTLGRRGESAEEEAAATERA